MRFNFDLSTVTLELSEPKNVLWIPAIPARELKAYQGRRVAISESYLSSAASETKRFYDDLDARGSAFKLPVLCAHDDKGRRSGKLLDFAVRDYKEAPTLFVKAEFTDEAHGAILSGSLAHGSISILPEYTDPESGTTYGPFIKEWSETNTPVVKGFTISELMETPSQLATLNLTLSEDNMTEQEQAFLDRIAEMVEAKIAPLFERLDALEGEETEEETEETEEVEAPAEEAPAVAASEDATILDFMESLNKRLDGIEEKFDRTKKARAKGGQISTTGVPISASEQKKKQPLSTTERLEQIKRETGLRGIEAVRVLEKENA